jgi:hypothetical protein
MHPSVHLVRLLYAFLFLVVDDESFTTHRAFAVIRAITAIGLFTLQTLFRIVVPIEAVFATVALTLTTVVAESGTWQALVRFVKVVTPVASAAFCAIEVCVAITTVACDIVARNAAVIIVVQIVPAIAIIASS